MNNIMSINDYVDNIKNEKKISKYSIWLYDISAREYTLLKNYFNPDFFNVVDLASNKESLLKMKNLNFLDRPNLIVCDINTELTHELNEMLYDCHCGVAKITTRELYAYTGHTFELTNRPITVTHKVRGEFVRKQSTMVEESLKKIADLCQLSMFNQIRVLMNLNANRIKKEINFSEQLENGKNYKTLVQDFLFKLADKFNHFIDEKDHYTAGHCQRVALYSQALGFSYGLSNDQTLELILAAYLHDIGKVAIPDAIINKTSRLSDEEFNYMKKHVELGSDILPESYYRIKSAVRSHHEKLDGTGYPDGLSDNSISLFAQILAIADSFDAMTSQRSYNYVKSADEAFEDLLLHTKSKDEGGLGKWYSEDLVKRFISTIKNSKTIMDELQKQKELADIKYNMMKEQEEKVRG